MTDYLQPEFYRFNEDSLKLVQYALKNSPSIPLAVADFGAGCGVIGIEYALKRSPKDLFFLEAQEAFLPYLKSNIESLLPKSVDVEIVHSSFSEASWEGMNFDLILCNPPFYLPGEGQASTDPNKNICRSFQLDSWETLLGLTRKNLADSGVGYFVIPESERLLKKVMGISEDLRLEVGKAVEKNLIYLSVRLNKN